MIALVLAQAPLADGMDFDALVKSIGACDRSAVTGTIKAADKRHAEFLLDAYKEQRSVAIARSDLAERRRRLRAKEAKVDTEEGLTLASDALDERARALSDNRALDGAEQDMVAYFRTQYLRQCSGKGL